MRIQTPRESRREIVGRISERLGIPARYEGAPGFAYTIGEIGIWAFKVILGMFAVSWYHDSSKAQIEGYRIGGKTATSEKYPRGTGKYISSFLGFAPANDPQVMAFVMIDEPTGVYYGGTIAAPVIQEVFSNILPYLGIPKEE